MKTTKTFEIPYRQYLDSDGQAASSLPDFAADPANLISLYRQMVLTRVFDAKAVSLQRTGRLGTFSSSLGQEATIVGLAAPMHPEDVLAPTFRENGSLLVRGVTPLELLTFWGGDERGNDFVAAREDFPICITVGNQAAHAAGAAAAFMLRGERRAVVCPIGDGATSKGEVYEAMNLAGAWSLPVVFVINNNQWAISVPRGAQTAAETLAQKAIGAGIEGEQVDGNDVIAVYDAVARALEKARDGGGPHVIEAITYRLTDHTTADDATRYREDAEVSENWHREPIARLRDYLTGIDAWTKDDEEALLADCAQQMDAAADAYLAAPPAPATDIFDYLFETLPPAYAGQRAALIRAAEPDGVDKNGAGGDNG